jgi:hypothetical protein
MKDDEYENYADAIEYLTPYYDELSHKLKNISDKSESMKFICND